MFYVGHFSFEGPEPEVKAESRERAWFTCVVGVVSVDAAVDEFRELVGSLKSWFTSFESVEAVYLYDVAEVERVPSGGCWRFGLTQMTAWRIEVAPFLHSSNVATPTKAIITIPITL